MKKIFGSLFVFGCFLFGVQTQISSNNLNIGETLIFTITSNNEDTKFPDITDIGGNPVLSNRTSKQISSINGKYSMNVSQVYVIEPKESFEIPSYTVEVDGKKEFTKKININVSKPSKSVSDEYSLEMSIDKNSSFVNESVVLNIEFKINKYIKIPKIQLEKLNLGDFWVEVIGETREEEGDFLITNVKYLISAKRAGSLEIPSAVIKLGSIEDDFFSMFSNQIKWKKLYSNSLLLDVKPLPQGIYLFGDFDIKASVDKNILEENEALNLTLKVSGRGNVNDIQDFGLDINNTIIYTDKAIKNSKIQNGEYEGAFVQKFAILANENFEIPGIEIKYFDGEKIVTKKTKPIKISAKKIDYNKTVTETKNNTKLYQKTEIVYKTNYFYIAFSFILGFLISGISFVLYPRMKLNKDEKLYKKINSFTNNKDLLKQLFLYPKIFEEEISKLESNIYSNTKYKIDTKKIRDLAKRHGI
ncbi:MAG: BatD [uncultured Campylobacterales bacterium]|uniref:BatD n=1 Tax=uncultured Campylobacterales bacterium TaxID=352960 RepID=A0A6S6S9W7_9BACT|nr:MAG: BatD [uncultured Campylobacterales bacterium]